MSTTTLRRDELPLAHRLTLPLLTADELAVHLALPSGRWVSEMARRREIPFIRVRKRKLYRVAAVVEALTRNEIQPLSETEIRAHLAAARGPRLPA